MELYQLRSFVAVAEAGSVTHAAERLYTTPPSVSAHIKALEDELSVQLFERTVTGMALTPKGTRLREKAAAVLDAAQDLVHHAADLQDRLLGTLTLGINAPPAFLRMPALLERLRRTCPGLDLHVAPSDSGQILRALQANRLDAGFLFGPVEHAAITAHELDTVALDVVAPAAWRGRVDGASWTELARLPWVDAGADCPFQAILEAQFADRGLDYDRAARTSDEATRRELVAAGVGLSLLPRAARVSSDAPSLLRVAPPGGDPLIAHLVAATAAVWNPSHETECAS